MLYVVTPCGRPQNIETIFISFRHIRMPMKWILILDPPEHCDILIPDWLHRHAVVLRAEQPHAFGGHAHRNQALRHMQQLGAGKEDWVWQLDDDSVTHPNFQTAFDAIPNPIKVFAQEFPDGDIRLVPRVPLRIGEIDAGNFVVRADIAFEFPWQESGEGLYNADGEIAERMYAKYPDLVGVSSITGAYWNALRPGGQPSGRVD